MKTEAAGLQMTIKERFCDVVYGSYNSILLGLKLFNA